MIRNLKALGLALVAVFAMSAMVASAAQAVPTLTAFDHSGTHTHAILSSEQTFNAGIGDQFRITPGKTALECKKVTSKEATLATGTSVNGEVTATPVFEECTSSTLPVTVETTSCDYRFTVSTKVTEHKYTGTVDVVCKTPGDTIHVKVFNAAKTEVQCEFTIEEQNGINGITYTNITPAVGTKDIEIDAESTNIKATVTKSKAALVCGDSAGTTVTTATYKGEDTIKAVDTEGIPLNLTISGS